jgi:GAF domain-containing protein
MILDVGGRSPMYQHSEAVANLDRMRELAGYDLFNTDLAEELGTICERTAERSDMPVAAVQAVLDTATATLASSHRDHPLASTGGGPNELAFCPQVVIHDGPFVVDDLRDDPVHCGNPVVVAGLVRSYAGVPLRLPSGQVLGSHCVVSDEPHAFTERDLDILREAGDEVVEAIRRYELSTSH